MDRALDHGVGCFPFRRAGGVGDFDIDHQAVAVFHQGMAEESQLRFVAFALFVQAGVRVGGRGVGSVSPLLAFEVDRGIAAAVLWRWRWAAIMIVTTTLGLERVSPLFGNGHDLLKDRSWRP